MTKQLVSLVRGRPGGAFTGARPNSAWPSGPLSLRMAMRSTPSLRAASSIIGSNITEACRPPGARCEVPGGVLVATDTPRKRMFGTWYISDALLADVAWSP